MGVLRALHPEIWSSPDPVYSSGPGQRSVLWMKLESFEKGRGLYSCGPILRVAGALEVRLFATYRQVMLEGMKADALVEPDR